VIDDDDVDDDDYDNYRQHSQLFSKQLALVHIKQQIPTILFVLEW
jgi:hypothetical protein